MCVCTPDFGGEGWEVGWVGGSVGIDCWNHLTCRLLSFDFSPLCCWGCSELIIYLAPWLTHAFCCVIFFSHSSICMGTLIDISHGLLIGINGSLYQLLVNNAKNKACRKVGHPWIPICHGHFFYFPCVAWQRQIWYTRLGVTTFTSDGGGFLFSLTKQPVDSLSQALPYFNITSIFGLCLSNVLYYCLDIGISRQGEYLFIQNIKNHFDF